MTKIYIYSVLIILFLEISVAHSEQHDFRKVNWGMKLKEVIHSEGFPPDLGRDEGSEVTLFYNDYEIKVEDNSNSKVSKQLLNKKVDILYFFIDKKLVRGLYYFKTVHPDKNKYIDDFKLMKKALKKKYGHPATEGENWHSEQYSKSYAFYPNEWGNLVSNGKLELFSTWHTDRTFIWSKLTGRDGKINHTIFYDSKEHAALFEENWDKDAKKDF
jgi:hypothetical protein